MKNNCRTDSKKHCMACQHYDYCDKANRCNGDCHLCDDYDCENNPKNANESRRSGLKRFNKDSYDGKLDVGDIIFDIYGNAYTVQDIDDQYYYGI